MPAAAASAAAPALADFLVPIQEPMSFSRLSNSRAKQEPDYSGRKQEQVKKEFLYLLLILSLFCTYFFFL